VNTPSSKPGILVWDLPLRVFHWLLAASFAGAFLTAESERWRDIHVMLGYTTLALVAFRVVWGFVGTRWARFASFSLRPSRVVAYLRSLLTPAPTHYTGHNPAGSWAILALLGFTVAVGASGLGIYNAAGGKWMEHLHEFLANAMLAIVAVHVVGVIAGSLLHRENLARAMVTGYKAGPASDGIKAPRRIVAALLLAVMVGLWTGVVPTPGLGTAVAMTQVKAGATAPAYTGRHD
jgi:cytochrome b